MDKLHDYDGGYSLGLGLGSDIRTKFALKDKARDVSSALVNLQVTIDGEIIGAENLASELSVPQMSGTDIDLDVTFASSIIRNEPKVNVAPASPPDDEELVEELALEIGELCQEAAGELTVSQMVASAAVSDVAFVVPNLEHNKAEVLSKLEAKLTSKYGEKLAKFVVTRLAPKFIPLVGQATLAKDVYDAVKEFEELSGLLEKRKAEDATKKQERSKVVVTASGSGDNNEDPDEDSSEDEGTGFDPSGKDNHIGVKRDERFGKLYQDKKDPKVWWSKDRGGDRAHGGEHWKKFEMQGKFLVEVEEVDMNGKVMNKNLEGDRVRIIFKDLIGIK